MTLDRVFFGALILLIAGSFAAVAFGLGDHQTSARVSSGIVSAVIIIGGPLLLARLK